VDLAHASPETVLGALKVATQPLIVSHTGLDSRTGSNPRMAEMMKPHLINKGTCEGRGRRQRCDRRVD
jgi:membrane dipeptidase